MNSKKFEYPMQVYWSKEDEAYIASVPDLPGCSAAGETEAAALREVEIAADLWIQLAKDVGRKIPEPSIDDKFSGKFLMRVPKHLHAELSRGAKRQGVSLNQYVLFLLTESHYQPKVA
tara:strand:+ start:1460 stop:1813 length:354 start_codon:yes stop_codon:yes gene_type:complete